MKLNIRRTFTIIDEKREEAGRVSDRPLRRIASVAVVQNPLIHGYVEDLRPAIEASVELARQMVGSAIEALGPYEVEGYGKGGLVGLAGELEHANALLTTEFAAPFRDALGRGKAWISSVTKVVAPGTLIDVPMNHVDDVYVRSHYNSMTLMLPETPAPDEIAVIFCLANRGRLNARVGGLTHEEVRQRGEAS